MIAHAVLILSISGPILYEKKMMIKIMEYGGHILREWIYVQNFQI